MPTEANDLLHGLVTIEAPPTHTLYDGLISYWPCEESGTGVRYDYVGTNHLTPTNVNGAVLSPSSAVSGITGKRGTGARISNGSFNFDALRNEAVSNPVTSGSLVFWARPAAYFAEVNPTKGCFLTYWGKFSDLDVATRLRFQVLGSGGSYKVSSSVTASAGQWYFVAIRFNPSTSKFDITVNGTKDIAATTDVWAPSSYLSFGGTYPNSTFDWDEIGLWNRYLSDDEVSYLYNGGAGRDLVDILYFDPIPTPTPTPAAGTGEAPRVNDPKNALLRKIAKNMSVSRANQYSPRGGDTDQELLRKWLRLTQV